jgi:RNA polymerase sigma-70 factor (ECF subfamily)
VVLSLSLSRPARVAEHLLGYFAQDPGKTGTTMTAQESRATPHAALSEHRKAAAGGSDPARQQPSHGGARVQQPTARDGGLVTDRELVRSAQQGDLQAFDELTRRHAARAYRTALAVLRDHDDAQDTTQDAFLAAWQGLAAFRGEAAFGTWLHRIVTRMALNKATRRRETARPDDMSRMAGQEPGPAEAAERAAAAGSVTAAVRALPAAQRSTITLHDLDGLSYAQIAALTHTTLPAVRSHIFRGRRALAAAVTDWR